MPLASGASLALTLPEGSVRAEQVEFIGAAVFKGFLSRLEN